MCWRICLALQVSTDRKAERSLLMVEVEPEHAQQLGSPM